MPLERSPSDAARSRNIRRMRREGYRRNVAAAAAYRTQRAARRSGGRGSPRRSSRR